MKIDVMLFGPLAEVAGAPRICVELTEPARVSGLLQAVTDDWPALAPLLAGAAVAVNQRYAGEKTELSDRDEVALVPPVSGG